MTWPDRQDDWTILYMGMKVARVHIQHGSPDAPPWGWGAYIGPMKGGRVWTLEEGLEAARNALLEMGPDLEREARRYAENVARNERRRLEAQARRGG